MTSLAREPDPRSVDAGHEIRDVSASGMLALAAALALTVVVVMAGLWYLLTSSEARARRSDESALPLPREDQPSPAPRLQDAPAAEYQQFQAEQDRLLKTYGWVDRQQGVVRIPIDRAIDLYLQHSEPPTVNLDDPALEKAP